MHRIIKSRNKEALGSGATLQSKRGKREKDREEQEYVNRFKQAITMDEFIHLPEFRVIIIIICKKCKYAVLPSQINAHFTPQRLYGFGKQERAKIIKGGSKCEWINSRHRSIKAV